MPPRSYASPAAFKQALEQHLRATGGQGAAFTRKRQLLVFDRFLARIAATLQDAVKTAQARARMKEQIEEALDEGLPRAYTPDVFKEKSAVLFQHVYERFGRAA